MKSSKFGHMMTNLVVTARAYILQCLSLNYYHLPQSVLVASTMKSFFKGMSLANLLEKSLQWVSLSDKTTF